MKQTPLQGMKIAVLVESQYIPGEIRIYQERFSSYGATVELVSRLWGNRELTFYSTVEGFGQQPESLTVGIDVEQVRPEDYAAVIMAANYTSVRLRYVAPPEGQSLTPDSARTAPAVRFFAQAMRNPNIVKAAPCHALWLLTPTPELLAGRKVTCNAVVLSDIHNAGADYIPPAHGVPEERQIFVDDDLVTSTGWHASEALVDAVRDAILERRRQADLGLIPVELTQAPAIRPPRGRRILVLVSEWGYWGEELVAPVEEFDAVGYSVDFCTPTGKRPNCIGVSKDPDFVDPPLGRTVTTCEMAAKAAAWDDPATPQGQRLDRPMSLAEWFPERPYAAAPNSVRQLEAYNRALDKAVSQMTRRYDALLIVGGSGPIVDLANNQRVHDLILGFHRAGRPVAAECYGVACLAFARDFVERKSIIWGKNVTGHCIEYDYHDGTGFMKARDVGLDFNMGPPPYPLEHILRDAAGPDGGYHGNFGKETSVIVDYPFITGRSTPDSRLTGRKLVEVLDGEPPLRRWGW